MEYGINFNGDLPLNHIIAGARISEQKGFKYIWVGEAGEYMHPFPLLALICENTVTIKIGSGIISPQLNRCHHILKAFETLHEAYGSRFVIGLAHGDYLALHSKGVEIVQPMEKINECILEIAGRVPTYIAKQLEKKEEECAYGIIPVFIGAAGPKTIELACQRADGILLNYLNPEYIRWAMKHCRKKIYSAAYGPSLLLPDERNEKHLLMAAAIVASGVPKELQVEFEVESRISEIKSNLIEKNFSGLKKHEEFLLGSFTISGTGEQISERILEIDKLGVDQLVFGTPLCRNFEAIKKIGETVAGKSS